MCVRVRARACACVRVRARAHAGGGGGRFHVPIEPVHDNDTVGHTPGCSGLHHSLRGDWISEKES